LQFQWMDVAGDSQYISTTAAVGVCGGQGVVCAASQISYVFAPEARTPVSYAVNSDPSEPNGEYNIAFTIEQLQ
jgi:hypothetical protein